MYPQLVLSLVLAAAPFTQAAPATQKPAAPATQKPAADTAKAAPAAKGVRTVEIVGTEDMKFSMATIAAKPGEQLRIRLVAKGSMPKIAMAHNFVVLNKGAKGRIAEGVDSEADMYRMISGGGNDSHVTQVLYGGGPPLVNSAGVPWTAAYIDTIGDPACDLRSNIAAEARAKIVYERLINLTEDAGVKDALGFLMTREIAHQQSFEKALYSIQPNFPPGKLPGKAEFTNVYFNMSVGEGDGRRKEESGTDEARRPKSACVHSEKSYSRGRSRVTKDCTASRESVTFASRGRGRSRTFSRATVSLSHRRP